MDRAETLKGSRLVIGPNWIGDAVMSLPVLRPLARAQPRRPLIVFAKSGPAAVYRAAAEGTVDYVVVASGRLWSDVAALRRSRPEEVWILPNSFRSALLAFLSGARERIGYDTDGRGFLLTHRRPAPPPMRHQVHDYDDLLTSRGLEAADWDPELKPTGEALAAASRALAAVGFDPTDRPVLLAPGAAWSWTKRWPPERYGRLARGLAEKGIPVGIVIGPGEEDLARRALEAAGIAVPVLGANLDPGGLAALLSLARAVVANDSGPMHLARAVGTPVVALFGPTDPGRTGPLGGEGRVIDRFVFCSPCFLRECPYAHECMTEIAPEDVLRALEEVMEPATNSPKNSPRASS